MNRIISIIVGLVITGVVLYGRHHPPKPVPVPSPPGASCHSDGLHPDPKCTPGSIYAGVTQSDIKQTICVTGWTATIRPPQSYTYPLKVASIKSYGYKDTNLAHYEEDHFIPLELGGNPTDVTNLWAEPGASPNTKDNIENTLRARVCSGKISLVAAQQKIVTDWITALK